jgi:hypothetical protein
MAGKYVMKALLGRVRCIYEDNTKMDLREIDAKTSTRFILLRV